MGLKMLSDRINRHIHLIIGLLLAIVYILSFFVPLNDNDAAHHATIALNMFQQQDWVNLISHNEPYLDKPHFQFWLLHLSYMLFGVTTFAYKISSLFFSCLTLLYTYRLALLLFNKSVAQHAVWIIATSFAFILGNVDVRMDAVLTGSVMMSAYHFISYVHQPTYQKSFLGALGAAMAFSTKGFFGVGIIGIIVLWQVYANNMWRQMLQWKFLSCIVFFSVLISPVLWAFHQQFDLQPTTVVRGATGHSGIKFILFEQITSRFGGEFGNASSNDHLFFFHTLMWSILPWSLLFLAGIIAEVKTSWRRANLKTNKALALVFPVTVVYIAMGFSQFKLPHHMLPTYPFAAIFVACHIHDISERNMVRWHGIQDAQYFLMALVAVLLNFWVFPLSGLGTFLFLAMALVLVSIFLQVSKNGKHLVYKGVIAVLFFWLPFNSNIFPQLLSFQGGQVLAKTAKAMNLHPDHIYWFAPLDQPFSFDYYTGHIHQITDIDHYEALLKPNQPIYLYIEGEQLKRLDEKSVKYQVLASADDYRITIITGKFLNPNTRAEVLKKIFLIKLMA